MKPTAKLENVSLELTPTGKTVAIGYIFGDEKNRFRDGTKVHTSQVVTISDDGKFIITKNSCYELDVPMRIGQVFGFFDEKLSQV